MEPFFMKKLLLLVLGISSLSFGMDGLTDEQLLDAKKLFMAHMARAAAQGNVGALRGIAYSYLKGAPGFVQSDLKAFDFFSKAADKGDALSFYYMGTFYQSGRCVDKDEQKALEFFAKAACQNIEMAQLEIVLGYAQGLPVETVMSRQEIRAACIKVANGIPQIALKALYRAAEADINDSKAACTQKS